MTNTNPTTNNTIVSSNFFTFDHIHKKIIGSEFNFKKSGIDGTAQYKALIAAMERHPNYTLSPVAPEVKKQSYKGLTFELIMDYVYTCADEATKEEFNEIVNRNEKFPFIKSWFLNHRKGHFSVEKMKQEIRDTNLRTKKAEVKKVVKARLVKVVPVEAEVPAVINF